MPWSDLAVLLGIVVASGWWISRLRRRGLRGGRFAAAAAVAFLGLTLVISMTAHCLDVLSRLAIGTAYDGTPFDYNFRTYSLLLVGFVLIGCGIRLLGISLRIGRSPADARAAALRNLLTLLALVTPLAPIQAFFAIPLCMIAGVAMLLVLWRVRPVTSAPATVATVTG